MRLRNFGLFVIFFFVYSAVGLSQNTYYWIGGSGDFQDPSHWSLTSDGPAAFLNPNNQDNVIFDASSFTAPGQVVTSSNNIFVRDMDWSGVTNNPTFDITNFDINIHGSLTLSPNMIHDVFTDYIFRANDAGHTINRNGQTFEGNVIFEGLGGGEWTLASDLAVVGNIEFNSGTFNSNGEFISATSFMATFGQDVTINLGTSNVILLATNTVQPQLILFGDLINLQADQASFFLAGNDSRVLFRGSTSFTIGTISFSGNGMGTIESDIDPGSIPPQINNLIFEGNGLILGEHYIPTLTLQNSYTVKLENGTTQLVDDIQTSGPGCSGDARLTWEFDSDPKAILDIGPTISLNAPVFYRGIQFVSQSTVTLNGGIDGGNNLGNYNAFAPDPRILYWVGSNGDWNNANNWSDDSGGPGGACIPRAIDNVVIDDNSFNNTTPPAMISNDLPVYLNSFEYTYSGNVPVIILIPELHIIAEQNNRKPKISGITITESLIFNIPDVFVEGTNQGGNTSNTDNQFIDVTVDVLNNLHIKGSSDDPNNAPRVLLRNDLVVGGPVDVTGLITFNTNGFNFEAPTFSAEGPGVNLIVSNSTLRLTGSFNGVTYPLTISDIGGINANGAEWVFEPSILTNDTGFDIDNGAIGRVTFVNEGSTARLLSRGNVMINRLYINADGSFEGLAIETDSTIFRAGHIYTLNAGMQFDVESYFEGLGDICNPIEFRTPGTQESVNLDPTTEINMSFITINNINANGGGTYFAGPGSAGTNSANWQFPNAGQNLSARQYLGPDIEACSDSPIVLEPGTNIDIATIEWLVNGVSTSTDLTFTVPVGDNEIISNIVTSSGCPIPDTVRADVDQGFTYDLGGPSMDVCQGSMLTLRDESFVNIGAQFMWSNGSNQPSITVDVTDIYSVTVTKGNCTGMDEVSVTKIELEEFEFADDSLRFCGSETNVIAAPNFQRSTTMFEWNDGTSTPTIELSSNTVPADGFYRIFVSEGTCSDEDSLHVTFDQPINQVLTNITDTVLCEGESFIQSVVPGFDSVIWSTGSMNFSIPIDANQITGTETFSVEVFRGSCSETAVRDVESIVLESFAFADDSLRFCGTEADIITAPNFQRNTTMFEWNDGTSTPTIELSSNTVPADGFYRIFVSEGGCSDEDSLHVTFDQPITGVLTNMIDTVLCEGESFMQAVLPGFDSVSWNTGSTDFSILIDANQITGTETFIVEAFSGACSETEQREVRAANVPKPQLGADVTLCESEGSLDIIKPSNVTLDFNWYLNNDPSTETSDTLTVPIIIGVRPYILEAQDGICVNRDTVLVTYESLPEVELGQDTLICQNQSVTLSVPTGLDSWTWSNTNQMTLTNEISTTDSIFVEASLGTCLVRDSIAISVLDLTALDIGPRDTTLCDGETLILDATVAGAMTYDWFPANSGATFDVTSSNQYRISVSADGCEESDTIDVFFDPQVPLFDLHQESGRIDSILCEGDAAVYEFNIPDASYLWEDYNQNVLSTVGSFQINTNGNYVVNISVGTCTSSDSLEVLIQSLPQVNLTDSIFSCDQSIETIDATTGNATYLWNTEETTNSIDVTTSGTYIVTATENKCPNTDSTVVVFRALPQAQLRADTMICDSDSIQLSFSNSALTYAWETPQGLSSDLGVTAAIDGAYIVEVTDDNNCTNTDTFNLTVNPTPFFDWPDTTAFCDGVQFDLTIPTSLQPTRIRWFNADGNPSIPIRNAGEVYADVFIETNGQECRWTDTTYIKVRPFPVVNFTDPNPVICSDSMLVLDATVPGATYSWSTGETSPTITVSNADTYAVTVNLEGCEEGDNVTVQTIQAPEVDLGMDVTICEGEMATLQVNDPNWNVTWSTGETSSSIVVPDGVYSVRVEDNGCFDEDEVAVSEAPLPVFDLGDPIFICDEVGTQLAVNIPNVSVSWNTGDNGPNLVVTESGIYSAVATTNEGCVFQDEVEVASRECVRFQIYRPTVFSPNNPNLLNGDNGTFKITPAPTATILDYEIQIFNRWGNLMYSSNDITVGWDGRINNLEFAKPGVYAYVIQITYSDDFDTNRTDTYQGDITLVN